MEDWKRVVWSDKTKINRFLSDGRSWVWKEAKTKKKKTLIPREVRGTMKHGEGSILAWGCMTWYETGNIVHIESRMNKELYTQILKEDLTESLEYYDLTLEDIIFQHDNDSKHTSKMTTN